MMPTRILTTLLLALSAHFLSAADPQLSKPPQPTAEHKFLNQFAGEWECANEVTFEGGEPVTSKGTMSGRMIGNFWVVLNVTAEDGTKEGYLGHGTLGFDSQNTKNCYGTWVDSMSPFLWKYEGKVDGNKLILDSEAPDPTDSKKMIRTRDTWEFKKDGTLVLTSRMEDADGKLWALMKSSCRRKAASKKK
jgi:hypothetical protein